MEIIPDDSAMFVMFTVVDWPANLNKTEHDDIPQQSILPLSEALDNLWKMISADKFSVEILQQSVKFENFLSVVAPIDST